MAQSISAGEVIPGVRVEHDPVTGEPILFELKHRAAPGEMPGLADQLSTIDILIRTPAPMRWAFDTMSWGSIGLFVLLLVVPGQFATPILFGSESMAILVGTLIVWVGLFVAVVLANQAHYRNYVTPTLLVRRYGLLGRGRKIMPVSSIENVEPDRSRYGSYGESVKLGDLRVLDRGGSTFIYHVFEVDTAAQAILDIKNGRRSEPSRA